MGSLPRIALLAAGCLLVTRFTSAVTMTPYDDRRSVTTEVCATGPGYCFTTPVMPQPGFPAFDADAGSSALPGAARATQHTSLDSLGMQGFGTADLTVTTPGFSGRATSYFSIAFAIDQAAAYTFIADIGLAVNAPLPPASLFSARVSASLGDSTLYFADQIESNSPAFEQGSHSLVRTGVLAPGNYWLTVRATGYQPGPQPSFASMSYSFAFGLEPVPEPSELAYVALTALGLGLLAAFRSTPR